MATATEKPMLRHAENRTQLVNSITSVNNGSQAMETVLLLDFFIGRNFPAGRSQTIQRTKVLNEAARKLGIVLDAKLPSDLKGYTGVLAQELAGVNSATDCLRFIHRLDLYADVRSKEADLNPVNIRRGIVSQAKRFLVRRGR